MRRRLAVVIRRAPVTLGAAAAFAAPARAAPAPADQCARCHRGIEDAHPKQTLAGAACHGGDPTARDAARAHAAMDANPSGLRIAEQACGRCHKAIYTSREHPKLEAFGQPADFRWDRIVDVDGVPVQVTTVEGARPLDRAEMDRLRQAPYKLPGAAANAGGE